MINLFELQKLIPEFFRKCASASFSSADVLTYTHPEAATPPMSHARAHPLYNKGLRHARRMSTKRLQKYIGTLAENNSPTPVYTAYAKGVTDEYNLRKLQLERANATHTNLSR